MFSWSVDGQQFARPPRSRDDPHLIFDVVEGIATAQVVSEPWVDFLHLARFGDRWLIVNALYETHKAEAQSGGFAAVPDPPELGAGP